MKDIRVAAVTFNSPVGESENSLERMNRWIKKAKKQNVSIICFPEMSVTGYSTRKDIRDAAETLPGNISDSIIEMADKHNIVILAGMAEKDNNGHIYASHLVVKPGGSLSVYRKLHLGHPELKVFKYGNKIPLFETEQIRFGIQLCYDAHFPELSASMAVNGADLIFMPHASPNGSPDEKFNSWMRHLPARAYDNSIFIVACNQVGDNKKGLHFPGVSIILNPSGNIIDKRLSNKESIIIADLKSKDLRHVRNHKMRYFLPNRRPELYRGE